MNCNILVDVLPDTVEINGVEYAIETNFRTFILFELLMQETELSDSEKAIKALHLVYPVVPSDLDEAVNKMIWFYSCGKKWREKRAATVNGASEVRRVYSFEHDDDYIYSAFLTQYGVDLQDVEYLHWWKFKAMFRTLSSDLEFSKIMEYRSVDIDANMSKEQSAFYIRMKELYALPLPEDEEQKLDAIEEALMNGGDLTGLL